MLKIVKCLSLTAACCGVQIAAAADVLFVFGSAETVSSKMKDLTSQLGGDKIVVPVLSSGTFSAEGVSHCMTREASCMGHCLMTYTFHACEVRLMHVAASQQP